jgi:hypothetical protein
MKNSLEAAALRALLQRSHGPAAPGDGGDDDAAGVVNFHIYICILGLSMNYDWVDKFIHDLL